MPELAARPFKLFLTLIILTVAFLFLWRIGNIVRLVVIAALLAYVLDPIVGSLESRGINRGMSTTIVLVLIMIFYSHWTSWTFVWSGNILWLPVFMLLAMITALGAGLWLSALNVQYRDIRYVVPFVIQIGMFASPVLIPSDRIPEQWQMLYGLYPIVGAINGFRWALGGATLPWSFLTGSVPVAVLLLISGLIYFRRMEKVFADVV